MESDEDDDNIWDDKSLKLLKRKSKILMDKPAEFSKDGKKKMSRSRSGIASQTSQTPSKLNEKIPKNRGLQKKVKQKRKRSVSSHDNASQFAECTPASQVTTNDCRKTPQNNLKAGSNFAVSYCPKCQMPFSALIGQSPGWHISDCLETKYSYVGDCPEGFSCKSTYSPHYKKYSHRLLAASRSYVSPEDGEETNDNINVEKRVQNSRQQDVSKELFLKPVNRTGDNSSDEKNWDFQPLKGSDDDADTVTSPVRTEPAYYSVTEMEWSNKSLKKHQGETCHENGDFKSNADESYQNTNTFTNTVESVNIIVDLNSHNVKTKKKKNTFPSDSLVKSGADLGTDVNVASPLPSQQHSQGSNECPFTELGSQVVSITAIAETDKSDDFAEVPSDEDFFRKDHARFKSFCESCDNLCGRTGDQVTGDISQGSVDFTAENPRSEDSSNERSGMMINKKDIMCDDIDKKRIDDPLTTNLVPAIPTSSQHFENNKKQSSLTTFVEKAHNQATGAKPVLRQTDIGVYFGLRALKKKTVNDNHASQLGSTMQDFSSKGVFHSHRNKSWTGKKKYNLQESKNPGYNSDGLSSFQEDVSDTDNPARKRCPFYKRIPDSAITVDAFRYGSIAGCRAYFLSHFHYDHYGGLTGRFTNHVYCSKITANLVMSKLYVKRQFIHPLPMNTPVIVENVEVTLLEANHCPGAVMFLFKVSTGQTYLHTGDFRATAAMEQYAELQHCNINALYLDTTYCNPEYSFPPQEETVDFAVSKAFEACCRNPKTLIVCGSYTIGKERVFLSIAENLNCKVSVQRDKKKILDCLESDQIQSLVTTDWGAGRVHVLPMAKLTLQSLSSHLESHQGQYTELLAFKPTGWEHSAKRTDLTMIKPSKRGKVTIYGVPYSEHSSFSELERFVKFVRPHKIVPTVNVYSAESRMQMQAIFSKWLA